MRRVVRIAVLTSVVFGLVAAIVVEAIAGDSPAALISAAAVLLLGAAGVTFALRVRRSSDRATASRIGTWLASLGGLAVLMVTWNDVVGPWLILPALAAVGSSLVSTVLNWRPVAIAAAVLTLPFWVTEFSYFGIVIAVIGLAALPGRVSTVLREVFPARVGVRR